jgi:hypothetical protein
MPSNTKTAHLDRGDRIEVGHPLVAASLMALGHELVGVVAGGRLLFRRTAAADYDKINKLADEARAALERANAGRARNFTTPTRSQGHEQQRPQ